MKQMTGLLRWRGEEEEGEEEEGCCWDDGAEYELFPFWLLGESSRSSADVPSSCGNPPSFFFQVGEDEKGRGRKG